MRKGQGSLEYLLILAAILAIAVVVVVVANSMLSAPEQQATLQQDKYACSLQGIEIVGYTELFEDDSTVGSPLIANPGFTVNYGSETGLAFASTGGTSMLASCTFGKDLDSGKQFVLKLYANTAGTPLHYNVTK